MSENLIVRGILIVTVFYAVFIIYLLRVCLVVISRLFVFVELNIEHVCHSV